MKTTTTSADNLTELAFDAADYAAKARSPMTTTAYARDWADFADWANAHDLEALPADATTVVLYLTDLAKQGRKPSTLARRVASISHAHQAAKLPSPTASADVRTLMAGIRRTAATEAAADGARSVTRQALALDRDKLARIVYAIDTDTLKGLRDRALLLIGFAGYFRRSELIELTVEALDIDETGIVANLATSKTDQTGEGTKRGIRKGTSDLDPVTALAEWLEAADITNGPVFRSISKGGTVSDRGLSGRSVSSILKTRAEAAGIDPLHVSGHSLRRGAATTAHRKGADALTIARAGGWADGSRTLNRYIEAAGAISDAPSLGL